ncbi:hypothetical protein NN6n1_41930 [Shinella zoogloeoides]
MVYLDNYLKARNERLASKHKPARVLKGDRRKHVIHEVMDILKDWRFSEFEHEASCRHGLRMAFCLEAQGWSAADSEACKIVATALTAIGAKRPSWDQGQREHTTSPDDCLWCGRSLPEDQITGGRRSRFCDGICARAHLTYRDFETTRSAARSHRQAYEVIARERRPEKCCEHCGTQYRPHSRRGAEDQRFCSKACADAAKLKFERHHRECATCAKSFLPENAGQKYCGAKCYAASLRKHRPRDCRGCGKSFTPYNSAMVYCSSACFHSQKQYGTRECEFCGSSYEARSKSSMYCGSACRDKAAIKRAIEARGGTYRPFGSMWEATCECCGSGFLTKSPRAKACTPKCRELLRLGKRQAQVIPLPIFTLEIFDGWFKRAA